MTTPPSPPATARPLPCGLAWDAEPAAWHTDRLVVTAGAATDTVIDPAGTVTVLNGAAHPPAREGVPMSEQTREHGIRRGTI